MYQGFPFILMKTKWFCQLNFNVIGKVHGTNETTGVN